MNQHNSFSISWSLSWNEIIFQRQIFFPRFVVKSIATNSIITGFLLKHPKLLHSISSVGYPNHESTQFHPPFDGIGLVHVRSRVFTPPSQLAEHNVQSDHSV